MGHCTLCADTQCANRHSLPQYQARASMKRKQQRMGHPGGIAHPLHSCVAGARQKTQRRPRSELKRSSPDGRPRLSSMSAGGRAAGLLTRKETFTLHFT